MFKPTRKLIFHDLTATDTPQELNFGDLPLKTIIDVAVSGAIRISINDVPANLDGDNGIFISYEKPLILHEHYIEKIKYIRDSAMATDIRFQIIGMY